MRIFILISLFICSLFAHKINLFISDNDGSIEIYSYFGNGAPCKECKLIIKNDDGIVLQDNLDENGKYNYTPKDKYLMVTIDAGGGHLEKNFFEVKDLKKEDITKHLQEEKTLEYKKIFLGLGILFVFFFLLKRFKR